MLCYICFIHLLFFKKERWLDTNYIEKTFVSPQTHLKSIKMKNGLPWMGKKIIDFPVSYWQITSHYYCIALCFYRDQWAYWNRMKKLQSRAKCRMCDTYNGAVQISPAEMFNPRCRKIFQISSLKFNEGLYFKWLFWH